VTASNGIVSSSPYTPLAIMTAFPIASFRAFGFSEPLCAKKKPFLQSQLLTGTDIDPPPYCARHALMKQTAELPV